MECRLAPRQHHDIGVAALGAQQRPSHRPYVVERGMYRVGIPGEAGRTPQIARFGDLEHRHARVLLMIWTEAAVVRAPVETFGRRYRWSPAGPQELPAPAPPLGVSKDQ